MMNNKNIRMRVIIISSTLSLFSEISAFSRFFDILCLFDFLN